MSTSIKGLSARLRNQRALIKAKRRNYNGLMDETGKAAIKEIVGNPSIFRWYLLANDVEIEAKTPVVRARLKEDAPLETREFFELIEGLEVQEDLVSYTLGTDTSIKMESVVVLRAYVQGLEIDVNCDELGSYIASVQEHVRSAMEFRMAAAFLGGGNVSQKRETEVWPPGYISIGSIIDGDRRIVSVQ